MVSNVSLAAACVTVGLHEHLHIPNGAIASSIRVYVASLETRRQAEYATVQKEGCSPGQYWVNMTPPKVCQFIPHTKSHSSHLGQIGAF
jgi:endoribonuclease Dicer